MFSVGEALKLACAFRLCGLEIESISLVPIYKKIYDSQMTDCRENHVISSSMAISPLLVVILSYSLLLVDI
jgi:hypothetical protein